MATTQIGAFQSKDQLAHLLDMFEVTITRDGWDIAKLVPVRAAHNRDEARAAIQSIRERAADCFCLRRECPHI